MNDLNIFMHVFMYELEIWLNEHSQEVLNISFQSDEANTDRPLKEYLKDVMENRCNRIVKLCANEIIEIGVSDEYVATCPLNRRVMLANIEHVFLPEEISNDLKNLLRLRKSAVFTNPDLCIAVNIDGKIEYETIELKSTKTDSIPGSSIQQILPDEWVIFIKHKKKKVEITTGQYFHAINAKIPFPDRSPRPQVAFSELQNWNRLYRYNESKTIIYKSSGNESLKYDLLVNWQNVLAERWVDIVLNDKPKKKESWFNNNLRVFILKFLKTYDNMSSTKKEKYKELLAKIIT